MSIILKVCLVSIVVPISWSQLMASEKYCSTRVCDPGTHVMCQYGKIKVGISCKAHAPARFNEAHKHQILNEINTKRANLVSGNEIGEDYNALPRGYAMSRVFWNDELARFAEVWVNQCIDKTDECRNTLKYRSVYQWISYTNWLDVKENLTNENIESSITAIFKWFWGERGHLTPSLITYYELEKAVRQNQVYLNMMYHKHTAVGCGMASMIVLEIKRVFMVCNFSNRLKDGDAVYPTDKPLQSTSICGCPKHWHETADCLCMPDEYYYVYYHLASPASTSRKRLTTSKPNVKSSHLAYSIQDMKDSVQNIPPIQLGHSEKFIIPMNYLQRVQAVQPTTVDQVQNGQLVNAFGQPQNFQYEHQNYIQPLKKQPVRFIQANNNPQHLRDAHNDAYSNSKTFDWVALTTQREFLVEPTSYFESFRLNKTLRFIGAAKYKTRNFTWMTASPDYTQKMFRSHQLATMDYSQNFFLPIFSLPPDLYGETTTERKLQSGEDMFLFFETKYQKPETTAVPIAVKLANEEINKTLDVYSNNLIYEHKIARNARFTVYDQHNQVNKVFVTNKKAKKAKNNKNDTTIVEQLETHFDVKVTTKTRNNIQKWNGVKDKVTTESRNADLLKPFFDITTPKTRTVVHTSDQDKIDVKVTTETRNADYHNIHKWNGVEDKVTSEYRTADIFKPFFDMTPPKTSTVVHTSDQDRINIKVTTETRNADYHNIQKWNGVEDKVTTESRTADIFKPFFDMTTPKTKTVVHTSDQDRIDVKVTTETRNADYHNIQKWNGVEDKVTTEYRTADIFKPFFDMTTPKTKTVVDTSDQDRIDVKVTTETKNADYHNIQKWNGVEDKVTTESRTADIFKPFFDMTTPKTKTVVYTSDQDSIDVKVATKTRNADYHNIQKWNGVQDTVTSESRTADIFKPFFDMTTPKISTVVHTSDQDRIDVKVTTETRNADYHNIHKWNRIEDKATTEYHTADVFQPFFDMSTPKTSTIIHTSDHHGIGKATESRVPRSFKKKRFEVKDVTSNSNTVGIYKTPFEVKKVATTTTGNDIFGYKSNIEMKEVDSPEPVINAKFDKPFYAEDTEILIRSKNKDENIYNQDFDIKEKKTTETNFVFQVPFDTNEVIREKDNHYLNDNLGNDNLDTDNLDTDNLDFDVNIEGSRRSNRAIGLMSLLDTLDGQEKQAKLNSKERKELDFARRMENVQEDVFAEPLATVMPLLQISELEENDEVDELVDFLKHKPNG